MSVWMILAGTAIAGVGVILLPGIGAYASVCVVGAAIAVGPSPALYGRGAGT